MNAEKKKNGPQKQELKDCFIIMPIADPEGYEKGHFRKVYEDIIRVACEKAGYNAVRADDVKETNLIHLDILKRLIESPMAICDLSNRNPNVLFELGLRQAFDKPTVLIQERGTPKIFDISPLRYTEYRKELRYREVLADQEAIENAIKATKESTEKGENTNSLISLLSLVNPASLKELGEKDTTNMLQVLMAQISEMRNDLRYNLRKIEIENEFSLQEKKEILFEFETAKMEYREYLSLVRADAPESIVTDFYHRIKNRLPRIIDRSDLPPYYRRKADDMLRNVEIKLSQYYAKNGGC